MPADHGPSAPTPPEAPKQATLLQVAGAVFWSFFGVRKGHAMQRDGVTIKPAQVIILGVLFGAMLVISLVLLVRFIIAHAAGGS